RPVTAHDDDATFAAHGHHLERAISVHVAEGHGHTGETHRVLARSCQGPHLLAGLSVEHAQHAGLTLADLRLAAATTGALRVACHDHDVGRVGHVDAPVAVGVRQAPHGRRGPDIHEVR